MSGLVRSNAAQAVVGVAAGMVARAALIGSGVPEGTATLVGVVAMVAACVLHTLIVQGKEHR